MKVSDKGLLSRALAATGAAAWEWDVDRPDGLWLQWQGSGEIMDIRHRIDDEDWHLLTSQLQRALLEESVFRSSITLGTPAQDARGLQMIGARVFGSDSSLRVSGLCWFEPEGQGGDDQARWAPLAKLSHELRSPLAGVTEQVREARSRAQDAHAAEALDSALDSCTYMLRIIQDMLAAFRAGEPEVSRGPQKVSTQRLLLQLVPFVADQAERKGLTLRVEQDKDFPGHFLAEPVALRRILQNLLDNAVKYTDRGGIVLRLCIAGDDRDGAWLCFGVEDTGPGMNGQEVARVFEPFSRGDEVGRRSSGLGIGLALSHQLAAALSGTLEVESEPGHGSRFRLLVPARVPDGGSEDPAMPDNGDLAAVHPGTRVLVVDDHPLLSKLTGRALRRLGSEVEVASTAREALLMVQSLTPDVIIIDLDLPDMSGFDLCRDLAAREHLADCRFVAYTGSDGSASRKAAEQAGFSAYLVKPASAEELLGI